MPRTFQPFLNQNRPRTERRPGLRSTRRIDYRQLAGLRPDRRRRQDDVGATPDLNELTRASYRYVMANQGLLDGLPPLPSFNALMVMKNALFISDNRNVGPPHLDFTHNTFFHLASYYRIGDDFDAGRIVYNYYTASFGPFTRPLNEHRSSLRPLLVYKSVEHETQFTRMMLAGDGHHTIRQVIPRLVVSFKIDPNDTDRNIPLVRDELLRIITTSMFLIRLFDATEDRVRRMTQGAVHVAVTLRGDEVYTRIGFRFTHTQVNALLDMRDRRNSNDSDLAFYVANFPQVPMISSDRGIVSWTTSESEYDESREYHWRVVEILFNIDDYRFF